MGPSYIELYYSGELNKRAEALKARLSSCDICPRKCGFNRLNNEQGFCRSGYLPVVFAVCEHHGEEPPISGTRGAGTIFFGNCNMRCLYCQNYQISQNSGYQEDKKVSIEKLAANMIYLQDKLGCHNIDLVSPTHFIPQIVMALTKAVPMGLKIPLVYNTNAYDSVDTLRQLEGIIDIYLPDIKYASDEMALKYSQTPNYVSTSRRAILEMHRQVSNLSFDENGLAKRGVIVRHLILPDRIAGSRDSLKWLVTEVSPRVTISIMSQYSPCHHAVHIPELSRRIFPSEYEEVKLLIDELGIENGWIQEFSSAEYYLPDFNREGHPFHTSKPTISKS